MSFFEFVMICQPILGNFPLVPVLPAAIILLQMIPFFFTFYRTGSVEMVSISNSWREPGSKLSVYTFLIYILIVYVCICSNSWRFQITVSISIVLIFLTFSINPEPLTKKEGKDLDDSIMFGKPRKDLVERKKMALVHRYLAFTVFGLMYAGSVCLISYNVGWPFDHNLTTDQIAARIPVFACYLLLTVAILGMLVLMLHESSFGREAWDTPVSALEHAYFDLFWVIIACSRLEPLT